MRAYRMCDTVRHTNGATMRDHTTGEDIEMTFAEKKAAAAVRMAAWTRDALVDVLFTKGAKAYDKQAAYDLLRKDSNGDVVRGGK